MIEYAPLNLGFKNIINPLSEVHKGFIIFLYLK